MRDYRVLDLELRLSEAEDRFRERERYISELETFIRRWEDYAWNRRPRPPVQRRVMPSGWRLLVVGPRYRKKRWQT